MPSVPGKRALEQNVFDEWPPSLRALFDGTALEAKVGFTASLITCDAGGHLRTSLLGIGELYAPDARCLAFALWPGSRAARTFAPSASFDPHGAPAGERLFAHAGSSNEAAPRVRAALTFVHEGAFYQVQLSAQAMRSAGADTGAGESGALAQFIASIDAGEMQRVGYARLTGGIAFELSDAGDEREAVLERWQRQIDRLRQAAHSWLAARPGSGGR